MQNKPVTNTVVVNMFGGPGCGKSTMTADVFARLKWQGIDCEMALEYAKNKVWEDCEATLRDQIYVFGKQLHRQFVLEDKVPVVLSDSPLLLSILYDYNNNATFRELVLQQFHRNHNINVLLKRRKKYVKNGRMQTLEEAIDKDNELRAILDDNGIQYVELEGAPDSALVIEQLVKNKLAELNGEDAPDGLVTATLADLMSSYRDNVEFVPETGEVVLSLHPEDQPAAAAEPLPEADSSKTFTLRGGASTWWTVLHGKKGGEDAGA
jgi:hypothetical protein